MKLCNIEFGVDVFQQWTDSNNLDLFCIGLYKDTHFRCINLIILGFGIEFEAYKNGGFNNG